MIVDLMLEVKGASESQYIGFSPIVGVTDTYENTTSNLEMLQNDLDGQKTGLDFLKQEIIARRATLLESVETIRQHAKNWKVEQSNNGEYTVTGFGLGRLNGQLVDGKWLFSTDSRQAAPASTESIDLVNILIAN